MKRLVQSLFLILVLFFFQGCKKVVVPSCIETKIEACKSDPTGLIIQVDMYRFRGIDVYIFSMDYTRIADASASVFDKNCSQICDLGGFSGNTKCLGSTFETNATFVKTIWKR